MLHFIDFEVFQGGDWLCHIFNHSLKKGFDIINNPEKLAKYYEKYKDELFIGYNIRNYDQYIFKAILLGLDPVKINNKIIKDKLKGWQISKEFSRIKLNIFDAQYSPNYSLKQLEAFQGHDIRESDVDFNTSRRLTEDELLDTLAYCRNDVMECINVFFKKIEEFDAYLSLIKTFNLDISAMSKTKAQLSAKILDCTYTERNDAFDIDFINIMQLGKYQEAKEFFVGNTDYKSEKEMCIAGVKHKIRWGGLHGAKAKYHISNENGKYIILHIDVTSYYPSMMIVYRFLSRSVANFDYYVQIYDTRVDLKKKGKKKEQGPYKIILNGTFGICKDKYNPAFDEKMANNVCINGQLLLIDLIEKMEAVKSFELIQSNTDGLIVKVERQDLEQLMAVCEEWEQRTRFGLEKDEIEEIWQKDVNNYVFTYHDKDGNLKLERKGGYVKETNELDNDLPIISEAMVNYMVYKKDIEETIKNETELIKFQKIVKVSSKYESAWYKGECMKNKVYRVFASRFNDGIIGKIKEHGTTVEKFANTPDNCFIDNTDITEKKCPVKLDKQYYINLTIKRLADFGINYVKKGA